MAGLPRLPKGNFMCSKKIKSEKLKGAEGFESYYNDLYGERWSVLKEALLSEKDDFAWQYNDSLPKYYLDKGSVFAALSLPLQDAQNILDLCAAPGGKTLVLASLMENDAILHCNERSFERTIRLKKVIAEHLPQEINQRIVVTCSDGAKMCLSKQNYYDRILLDAPCSSERHVLTSSKHLSLWSPARIKTLAVSQWALLSSAYRMLKPQGYILYSTCALSSVENDQIVYKLIKKFKDVVIVKELKEINSKACSFFKGTLPKYEHTEYGFHILPDLAEGAGPLYFCLIQKNC